MKSYFVEFTDTFGGEANYSWVRRYLVSAKSMRGAITVAKRAFGMNFGHKKTGYDGDQIRLDFAGTCICCFIQYVDEEDARRLIGIYNIEDER